MNEEEKIKCPECGFSSIEDDFISYTWEGDDERGELVEWEDLRCPKCLYGHCL